MEKVLKTLEALKVPTLPGLDSSVPGNINSAVVAACDSVKTKKKERISHCVAVTDAVCSSNIQALNDYAKILEKVTEVLFQLCNDSDSDIRLVASDCLHRIVRTLKDQYQHRFQMEVYKEIKKNQNPRSLRLALNLFAFMSPLIRPQKCRVFMLSLLPCFAQIAKRTEETLYEHLPSAVREIFMNLGPFVNDNEVKILCKEFLINLTSSSSILRRSSASILVYICQYSRKPHVFLPKLLTQVTELLLPNLMQTTVPVIIGALLCIRQCIQPLFELLNQNYEKRSPDQESVVKNLIQIYEMCMILCNHDDHNVITTSLETLQQLLSSPAQQIVQHLASPVGIQNSLDTDKWDVKAPETSQKSSSMCSLAFSDTTNLLEGDSDVPNFRSLISSTASEAREGEDFDVDISIASSRRNSDIFTVEGSHDQEFGSTLEVFHHSDEEQVQTSYSLPLEDFPEVHIGSLYNSDVPFYYCARFMAYNFLLAGKTGHCRPDTEIRISVKVLAMNCLSNLISVCPEIFNLPLAADGSGESDSTNACTQTLEDILLYLKHLDPLLRGSCYILIGHLVQAQLKSHADIVRELPAKIISFVANLNEGFGDSSNIGVKCAISGISNCVTSLVQTQGAAASIAQITENLLSIASSSYWLVKVDIVDFFSKIEWDYIPNSFQKKREIIRLYLELLSDEHARVRAAVNNAFIKFINLSCATNVAGRSILCPKCVLPEVEEIQTEECVCTLPVSCISFQLEWIMNELIKRIDNVEDKHATDGFYCLMASLSEKFPPSLYKSVWRCGSSTDVCTMFAQCMDILRSSPIIYDMSIHQNVLIMARNLFLGFISNNEDDHPSFSEGNLFFHPDPGLSARGAELVHHCLGVMKLYQNLLDSTSPTPSQSQVRKLSTSPVISPVKKFSQKLESEKKSETEQERRSKNVMFACATCPEHFKKIGEHLAQNWKVYQSNLDPQVTTKFTSLLITSLHTLGCMFEHIRSDYIGLANLIDDVLVVMYSVFYLCPTPTLICVQKMLKCLFSLAKEDGVKSKNEHNVVQTKDPVESFRLFAATYHKRLSSSRRTSSVKSLSEKSVLGSYIRQFEPVVVTALRMYTTSSDVNIQAEVLRLLSLLIKSHVNYGLVDKSQVFLGFVIKQIGFLEEGHIRNDGHMVEKMFEFLTLLSHEQHHSSRFIDIPKILRLCDGLVVSGQNPVTHSIPALKKVARDLFVLRCSSNYSHAEKKEIEAQREVAFQMLMKLPMLPQTLPVLWIVIEGRRSWSEIKWNEDSATVAAYLLPMLENGELEISTPKHFRDVTVLLFSLSPGSLPPAVNIIQTLEDAMKLCQHIKPSEFAQWQLLVTTHWLLLVKLFSSKESPFNVDICNASFIVQLLHAHVTKLATVVTSAYFGTSCPLAMDLVTVFLQSMTSFFRVVQDSKVVENLKSDEMQTKWLEITTVVGKLAIMNPGLRLEIVEMLTTLLHPSVNIWEVIIRGPFNHTNDFEMKVVLRIMKELNKTEFPSLETWITSNHLRTILKNIDDETVTAFIARLSAHRIECLINQLRPYLTPETELLEVKNILKFLERVYRNHVKIGISISLKLLQCTKEPFLSMEISQFVCFLLTVIKGEETQFSEDEKLELSSFLQSPEVSTSHPRLVNLIQNVGAKFQETSVTLSSVGNMLETPIARWCCGEINHTEGTALAKLLSNLSYPQIINIFNSSDFNLFVLSYCFSYLRLSFARGVIPAEDILDLFSSETRSTHVTKWPLAVATFDFLVEMLDKWESLVGNDDQYLSATNLDDIINFCPQQPGMWQAAEKMLRLKDAVINGGSTSSINCKNNFIPTNIFTFSFHYMQYKCSRSVASATEYLKDFLPFASLVIQDSTFRRFFNVRDDHKAILCCVKSLGVILRHIVCVYNLNFPFSESTMETWWSEMNPECLQILKEFDIMTRFICQVEGGFLPVDKTLFECFRLLVAGLGSCDIVHMWILISHLGWKPPLTVLNQCFPPVPHIPLEILQNEKDLLLQYIFKLKLFGVSSKISFEENWMTFLSVINSYGEENFPVQIVCTGLRALSMVLENTVKFYYHTNTDVPMSNSMKGLANLDLSLKEFESELCTRYEVAPYLQELKRCVDNPHDIDLNSCIRFLTDLFSQWLQNPQGKMPLILLSEVVQVIVKMAEYFEDTVQYTWMFETLTEIFKSFEKEDEVLWPHLLYGLFFAAAKIPVESDVMNNLVQILEGALVSPCMNVSKAAVESALVYLQNHPNSLPVLNVVTPYALKNTHLSETTGDSESRSCAIWNLLLFAWIHGPTDNVGVASFEQETLSNILTVLSPLNKVYISVRLLVLKGLRKKVISQPLPHEVKRKVAKVAIDTMRTRNICIFFETIKLYAALFYKDFEELYQVSNPDPEALMQMVERTEILFQILKQSVKFNALIVSKLLRHITMDYFPPSEILNRVIAEFFNPHQNNPELVAPVVAQLFEKARRKPKEAALVREWIVSSVPNFLSNTDINRVSWSLTLFFIGVSTTPEVINYLPFAELRRRPFLNRKLFIFSALDFYSSLTGSEKLEFFKMISNGPFQSPEKNPYKFLADLIVETESKG